ncbi:hypothetical protein ASE48_03960 [Mycobacterium sp. Root265]|nr:hypothetical protein ASE48_03960 [Mycobacterium sp. Root265]
MSRVERFAERPGSLDADARGDQHGVHLRPDCGMRGVVAGPLKSVDQPRADRVGAELGDHQELS